MHKKIGWRITHGEYKVEGWIDPIEKRIQRIVRRIYFIGILVSQKDLRTETVPSFAWIQTNCLGWTDWKSEFPKHLFNHTKYPIFKTWIGLWV